MNLLPSELLSRSAGVCALDGLDSVDLLSGRSSVFVVLLSVVCRRVKGKGGVPRWVAERLDFPGIGNQQFQKSMTCLVEGPFGKLLKYMEAMTQAATMIIT